VANPVQRLRVARTAPRAQTWLQETKQAHVLYSFERVLNLVNQEGNVLALASDRIGAGPFSLVLEPGEFLKDVEVGANLLVFENGFWLDDWLIDSEEADIWEPTPRWQGTRGKSKWIVWAAKQIRELLIQHAEADSLAQLVVDPVAISPLPARIIQAAEQHIPRLFTGIQQRDIGSISKASKGLAGIGPGLTPAGDDLLLGALHGIWATLQKKEALELGDAVVRMAAPRTHALSAAWLEAAAAGEAGEPWHTLVEAIAAHDEELLRSSVMRILPTGHTSGSDALGGFLGILESSVH